MEQLAIIDLETTGLNPYRNDRIVEVAVVLWTPEQGITAELDTLVNPERDIGPTSIHGIAASDIMNAPRFAEITEPLHDFWRETVALVGHNVRFDSSFLRSEYARIGVEMPEYAMIDTMALAGGGCLSACCAQYGIENDGKFHSALNDARANASLFQKMLPNSPDILTRYRSRSSPVWPNFQMTRKALLSRRTVSNTIPTPSYVKKLAQCLSVGSTADSSISSCEREYRGLLWRVLEDGRLEESEENALIDVAVHWGLSLKQVQMIHMDYLTLLAKAVCADGSITDSERRDVGTISQLLGFGILSDEEIRAYSNLRPGLKADSSSEDWAGKSVCFTGECCCHIHGQLISRQTAEQLASSKGLQIAPRVTKKLDILVVSDPNTQSSKAKKAKEYGTRIVHEPVFWRSLGVQID